LDWTKVEQAIRRAIDDRNARDAEQRARVYAAARAALGRRREVDEMALARFDKLARQIETGYAPEPSGPRGEQRWFAEKWNTARQWLLFVAGLIVGAGGFLIIDVAAMKSIGTDEMNVIRNSYKVSQPQVPVAMEFLHVIADAVIKAQSGDRKKLDTTAKGFVPLAKFDTDLAKEMPSSLPKGSSVILRADDFNFKILFNWPLCGTVSISNPPMVDPVRSLPNSIGCPFFGLWTPAASSW
jgi:hypothetical protein